MLSGVSSIEDKWKRTSCHYMVSSMVYNCSNSARIVEALSSQFIQRSKCQYILCYCDHLQFSLHSAKSSKLHLLSAKHCTVVHVFTSLLSLINHTMISGLAVSSVPNLLYSSPDILDTTSTITITQKNHRDKCKYQLKIVQGSMDGRTKKHVNKGRDD